MAGFLEQLSAVELRYEEMTHLLSQPDVAGNNQRYTALMKEYTELTPLVECWRAYRKAEAAHREAKELLAQGGLEKDFREMVEEELEVLHLHLKADRRRLPRRHGGGGAAAKAPPAAQGPQRPKKCHPGDTGRRRGGGSRPLCREPLPDVHHVHPAVGLADGASEPQ